MAANKKPKKKYRPKYSSKAEMVWAMKESGRRRSIVSEMDKAKLVATAQDTLERMKTHPDQNGLIDLIDITNVLCDLIHLTDTDEKRKKYFKCPDIHFHLWNKGFGSVSKTVNAMHYALYEVEKRVRDKGSYTINSSVMTLFTEIVEMYKEALNVAPRGLIRIAIADSRASHKEEDGKFRPAHFELHENFYINEEVWDEMLTPEVSYAT